MTTPGFGFSVGDLVSAISEYALKECTRSILTITRILLIKFVNPSKMSEGPQASIKVLFLSSRIWRLRCRSWRHCNPTRTIASMSTQFEPWQWRVDYHCKTSWSNCLGTSRPWDPLRARTSSTILAGRRGGLSVLLRRWKSCELLSLPNMSASTFFLGCRIRK